MCGQLELARVSAGEFGFVFVIRQRYMSIPKTSKYLDYTIGQMVYALCNEGVPGSQPHEEIKGALSAKLITGLADAIDRHERAASRLATRVLIFDCVLGVFTVAGSILAAVQFFR